MTPKELQKSLDFLDLNPTDLARITQADERTARRWVRGESPIPRLLELLLHAWQHSPELVVAARREARQRQREAAAAAAELTSDIKTPNGETQ